MSQIENINFDGGSSVTGDVSLESGNVSGKEEPIKLAGGEGKLNLSDSTVGPENEEIFNNSSNSGKKSNIPESDEDDISVAAVVNNSERKLSLTSGKETSRHSVKAGPGTVAGSNTNTGRLLKIPREVMFQKLESLGSTAESLMESIVKISEKLDAVSEGVRSLLVVNEALNDSMGGRLEIIATKLQHLDSEILKCNSIRHEAKLQVIQLKMENMEMLLKSLKDNLALNNSYLEKNNDSLLGKLEAKFDGLTGLLEKGKSPDIPASKHNSIVSASISSTSSDTRSLFNDLPDAPGSVEVVRRKRNGSTGSVGAVKPTKQAKLGEPSIATEDRPTGIEDLDKKFSFACRHGILASKGLGKPSEFSRSCRFQSNLISHLRDHRSKSKNHGDFYRDGTPSEISYRKTKAGQIMCTKLQLTTNVTTECGVISKNLGQHNRHARSVTHRDDILIINRTCKPCGSRFKTETELLDHVVVSKCLFAKGVFGKDSRDPDASGLTCPTCGKSGFSTSSDVFQHQNSNSCKISEVDDE